MLRQRPLKCSLLLDVEIGYGFSGIQQFPVRGQEEIVGFDAAALESVDVREILDGDGSTVIVDREEARLLGQFDNRPQCTTRGSYKAFQKKFAVVPPNLHLTSLDYDLRDQLFSEGNVITIFVIERVNAHDVTAVSKLAVSKQEARQLVSAHEDEVNGPVIDLQEALEYVLNLFNGRRFRAADRMLHLVHNDAFVFVDLEGPLQDGVKLELRGARSCRDSDCGVRERTSTW